MKLSHATILLLLLSLSALTAQASYDSSRTHSIQKRSCSMRGEECLKDIDCCTAECVCSTNFCKCGSRPKVKISINKPQSMAQRLICRY